MVRRLVAALALALTFASPAAAAVVTEAVPYRHDGVELEGYLAYDAARAGRGPAVIVVHEWWGLTEHPRRVARELAELGYVAFATDMYGKGVVTQDAKRAAQLAQPFKDDPALARARAAAGYELLRGHERVDPARIAAIGYCFGGTQVLQMAYAGLELAAVVSFHGHPVPPGPDDRPQAKILICHGAADTFVPEDMIASFKQAMARLRADWTWIEYGGAVHGFTNPDAGKSGLPGVAYQEQAARRSWEHMRQFLREALGE